MKIWVDADACPKAIKEILFRAAQREQIPLTLVANQSISVPNSIFITCIQVKGGFDEADNEIIRRMADSDLIITGDIPLAAEVLENNGLALSPRGELFQESTIGQRLRTREFLETLRSMGEHTGGPPPFDLRDRKSFSDQLDRILRKRSTF
jgi:uncharacterized protein YaiI (UPF0178 family)